MIKIREIDHIVLRVVDLAAMEQFYCEVLGCSVVKRNSEFDIVHLQAGGAMIDLVPVSGKSGREGGAAPGREGRNVDHFCFRVEAFDGDAIAQYLRERGITPGELRQRFGAEGNGLSLYFSDPEGNTVELKGRLDQ